jgi:hypothetical protein
VMRHNMDIVSLYMMNDNDNQENDYHILLMNNNNIFHKNYPNVHNNNVHYMDLNVRDHTDNMYDVFVRMLDYFDDLIIVVDYYVDDESMMNEDDEMLNDGYLSKYITRLCDFILRNYL